MVNVCQQCGAYRADKMIDPAGAFVVCPECRHKRPFLQLPLLLICGASGTGKSTICNRLAGAIEEAILLEGDILWRDEFNRPEDNFRMFFETWLRMSKNIGQSGKPIALFSAGAIPDNIEPCVERRYFSKTSYLALICDDDLLASRLKERPTWRQSGGEANIETQIGFNQWLQANAELTAPQIDLFNTSDVAAEETASQVAEWIRVNSQN